MHSVNGRSRFFTAAKLAVAAALPPAGDLPPVLLIAFNRPATTERVFSAIREAKPSRLYIATDAARPDVVADDAKCAAVADLLRVDWDCDVRMRKSPSHLGCRDGICAALDWFFEREEAGIIVEDDCVPNASFWRFCTEMLERYRDDDRIASIAGSNYEFGKIERAASYHFSRHIYVWGWATWRRVWQNVDRSLDNWPELRESGWLADLLGSTASERFWSQKFDAARERSIDAWSYYMVYSALTRGQMSIVPSRNLTTNIGFGPDAVHTRKTSRYDRMATQELDFPLIHPHFEMVDETADRLVAAHAYSRHVLPRRVLNRAVTDVEAAIRLARERRKLRIL
ncbi:MAG: glycosyltransferase family 2 protein [Fimbriimonadaceae bacterium]